MNELLGLFGYDDKVNSTDTESLNLDNFADNKDEDSSAIDNPDQKLKSDEKVKSRHRHRLVPSDDNPRQHMNFVTVLKENEKEEDSGSKTDQDPITECTWCRKIGNKQVSLETPVGNKVFCSEVCFTQCRRASFKKSKTCDWCKHIRHTVNYVEFQDGETQLQFCGEKCLNQYKMSIFCKETQEHLHKMNKKDSGSLDDKEDEHQILITPELWMRGEQARRAAEARESARERERSEANENRENYRKGFTFNSDKDLSRNGNLRFDSAEKSKQSLLDRIKQEANLKHRRSLLTDRNAERSSPPRSEREGSPASPQNDIRVPNHFLHPSFAAMAAPWIHQAQLVGAFTPGFLPYGPIPPVMLTGYVPPPSGSLSKETREKDEQDKRRMKADSSLKYNHSGLLSPASESSAMSGSSPRTDSRVSPTVTERRTSSLFPVDFPQYLSGQNGKASLLEAAAQRPAIPGVPPVTMMFPFPVPLPLPVPIPIPIPLTMQQLTTIFGEKGKDRTISEASKKASPVSLPKLHVEIPKEARSPAFTYPHSPHSVASLGSDYEKNEGRSGSRSSCPDLSTSIKVSEISRIRRSESQSYKRSRTPETLQSLDLSKNSKIPRYEYHSTTENSNDGVIDLSSTRNNIKIENTEIMNGNSTEDSCLSRDDNDNYTEDGPPLPKIHIITHTDDQPLNQPLPLPPTDNSYSSRRGLILDAPAIPKKSRSPSPERRVYVRNVPRDIIEAARRRCMRARIRTK